MNWITFGKLILKVYHHLEDNKYSLVSWYKWEEWVGKAPEFLPPPDPGAMERENVENVNGNGSIDESDKKDLQEPTEFSISKSPDSKGEDENGDSENQDSETKKSGNRRRCSDLDHLKEWGWHKNRRSSRKKQKEEEEAADLTINGFIKRILPNYFVVSFDSNRSPFALVDIEARSLDDSGIPDQSKTDAEDEEKFYELTKDSFAEFMDSFKYREFDLVIPMFQWLRFISLYWDNTVIPTEILLLFKKIYKIYEDFVDYHSMYHLSDEDFESTFRMALFYFELLFDEFEETKAEIPDEYMRKKDFLQVNIGFIDDDMKCTKALTRLVWLSYCMQIHNNNYKDALGYLYKLEEVYEVPKYAGISVELKNCKNNKQIDGKTVKELTVKIERKINLASVNKLYETQNYEELVEILRESIIYSTEPKVNIDHLTLKITTQIEVFLKCLWSLNRITECLIYAEKSLRYAVDNFLQAPTEYRLEEWASLTNYCLVYIDAAVKDEEGSDILFYLKDNLSRLVQTLTQIITHQLDSPVDKNNLRCHLINLNVPWTILYHLVLKENDVASVFGRKKTSDEGAEEEFETVPNSLSMFFTAHEFLGRKQWCMKDSGKLLIFLLDILVPIYRTPLLEPFRDTIAENLEQTTYCLYGYPAKKVKLRHIEEHDARNVELTWERAIQLFDLYRPDTLPEFDSFKLSSITSEMEQLLQKIILLIPKCLDISPFTGEIKKFINGTSASLPKEINILPAKIASIYYLLADFYFKNRETGKAIKFYISDLTMKPDRFDSWASLSLCKQSKLEMKLNSNASIEVIDFLEMADQTINCFNQCLKIKKTITILTEFASFTYHLQSFCSRNLKQSSETLSMENFSAIEERKDKFLNISFRCFSEVSEAVIDPTHELNVNKNQEESDDSHDEKWYYHFMLGKISEKRKEPPGNYLKHYLESAKYLYEDNATYPIKLNHSNPSHLAIESLEVFYRISGCIMKYLEQHSKINKLTAKLFLRVLKEMASSPFAINRAKINKGNINAMKHKLNTSMTNEGTPAKLLKPDEENQAPAIVNESEKAVEELTEETPLVKMETDEIQPVENSETADQLANVLVPKSEPEKVSESMIQPVIRNIIAQSEVSNRRGSQESAITTTTTTSTRTSSSSDSSADSSSDSDSSSSDETDGADKENVFVSQEVINNIYKMCIKNLEECVSRFPEHYKSIYRLVHHFANAGDSMEKCKQLLLSSNYKTTLGNPIGGLFSERKNNNFFNGIWRNPSQEIDRPGNFTTHLSKCVIILMDVLKKTNDYETLMDLALQLQRNPEADKKYLNDADKKELFQQAVACCVQAFKNKLRDIMTGSNDDKNRELLSLMLDIFKSHRKSSKIFQAKDQSLFSAVLVDVYKEYIKDKMILPDNANLTDLAFKMCQQESVYRKNLEKGIVTANPNPPMQTLQQQQQMQQQEKQNQQAAIATELARPILVKSVSEINKSVISSSGNQSQTPTPPVIQTTSNPTKSSPSSSGSSARTKPRSSSSTKSSANAAAAAMNNNSLNQMLMSLYANPQLLAQMLPTDSSNYINEYYKSLMKGTTNASASSTSATSNLLGGLTPQQLAIMNDPMASLMSGLYSPLAGQSPSTSPSSSKATSSYEKKYLESLQKLAFGSGGGSSSSPLLGLQQNLMSNSLSISTTAPSSTSTSKSSNRSQSSQSKKSQVRDSAQMSKISSDSLFGSGLKLPDLPKSLSITPSTMPTTSNKANRVSDKGKSAKEKSSPATSGGYRNSALSITTESLTQSAYQEFLKTYNPAKQNMMAVSKKSAPVNVSSSASLLKPMKSKSTAQSLGQGQVKKTQSQPSLKSAQAPYDFGKNIASSFSGLPMSSPTLSASPFSLNTPPLAQSPLSNVSPQKTLQQKLAERKQQNTQPPKKKQGMYRLIELRLTLW